MGSLEGKRLVGDQSEAQTQSMDYGVDFNRFLIVSVLFDVSVESLIIISLSLPPPLSLSHTHILIHTHTHTHTHTHLVPAGMLRQVRPICVTRIPLVNLPLLLSLQIEEHDWGYRPTVFCSLTNSKASTPWYITS